MAVNTQVSIEEYLHMSFEHDREYVRGELVERALPTLSHSDVQNALSVFFQPYRRSQNLFGVRELRLRLRRDVVRIPDVSLFVGKPEEVPSTPVKQVWTRCATPYVERISAT
jgi:Uma2 family endonuclease